MTGFLAQSSCSGRRPNHLASRRHYPRPDLIARLLRERHVARFLVAPQGFGKSGLAMEYSDTVFSFEHVFWINGRSPCFLRDLDRGIIVSTLTEIDGGPFLVVVEDVPQLDAARAASLSASFDELLERGCEVLATCTPSCDAYASLQHDRLKLAAVDLLLSDAEVDVGRSADERADMPASSVPAAKRVPGLVWGAAGALAEFLGGIVHEELPADMLLAVSTMLVLEQGALSDVEAFGPCGADLVALLAANYPYLGIDERGERFSAPAFPAPAVASALAGKLEALVVRSHFPDRDALVIRWADVLVARSACERACELVGALCSRAARSTWLAARSCALIKQACILPGHVLYSSLGKVASSQAGLELGEAMRLVVLGDEKAALARARRLAFDLAAPEGVRALAALALVRRGKGAVRDRACDELGRLARTRKGSPATASVKGGSLASDETFWRPLALAQLAMVDDPAWLAAGEATVLSVEKADEDALVLASAWALGEVAEGRAGTQAAEAPVLARMEGFVRSRLSHAEGVGGNLFVAAAGLALERARERGMVATRGPLDADEALALHQVEVEVFSQRRAFARATQKREERRAERVATHPDWYLDGRYSSGKGQTAGMVPLLTVSLFGGLSVRIGGDLVDGRLLRRQKVKELLALLVLNRGREFPRDRLVSIIWPGSELEGARKNFYSVWSQLRRALSDPTGSCPYLIRQQNGCRLDDRLLSTDVARFDAVCRMLLFGQPGADGWASLYAEIDDAFVDDLMPSERDNDYIVQERERCRMQLVDALVAAADRLVAANNAQEGLWFARAALRRDHTREDAYTALMQAQIAAGQRTAALETYFQCRRFLADELGIDPSLKTMALYRSIIETETDFE